MARIKSYDYDMAGGDTAAMKRLYTKWIKVANERIRVTTSPKNISHASAYKYMVKPLQGAPYVKENKRGEIVFKALPKNASARDIREAFKQVTGFLGAKTSTVSGITSVMRERRDNIRESLGIDLSDAKTDSLLRFLGSPEGKAAMQQYDSDMVVEAIALDLKRGGNASVLERWQAWEKSGETLADWMASNGDSITERF